MAINTKIETAVPNPDSNFAMVLGPELGQLMSRVQSVMVSMGHYMHSVIDEMLNLSLLTFEQHRQISSWIAQADTPDDILRMPVPLWQAVERASAVMGIDDDLMRPPTLDAGDSIC